ncbi:acetyl/propionyl/methylcrotonyl-CoA carboxylase subunit alpha [Candidatus Neomarinimicrobiota bacterium]
MDKILIANRGEIAVRIIRSCRELEIPAVAIYSEADRTAPHVLMADEALCVGPAPSIDSYLNVERILDAAQASGANAIHPGYGFLSENASFARSIINAGLIWIGPAPDTLDLMGDKVAARGLAASVGAPTVPGSTEPVTDLTSAEQTANEIGYPVLIKAAGGGGGKGIRVVENQKQFRSAYERARSEAASAFADDRVYVEKMIVKPHHVEVQIFADGKGNIVCLGERECSIQRRYQKIIEETPSPFIKASIRNELSTLAVDIARACRYTGAGTVEFLVGEDQSYYFLEMNTRLQVEHPITEMVTGIDLVAEQIRAASGQPLSIRQQDIQPSGHAIECRIYAEDGFDNFTPSVGTILELTAPGGPGVRLDHGIREGLEITPYYDPILGKLCTWGTTRPEAVARMARALEELRIIGIRNTVPFCMAVMHHPVFKKGTYCTHFISDFQSDLEAWATQDPDQLVEVAALGAALFAESSPATQHEPEHSQVEESLWARSGRERQVSQ